MDTASTKTIVEFYQKPLFSFILVLTACGREKAFEMTVSTFANALKKIHEGKKTLNPSLEIYREALNLCRSGTQRAQWDFSDLMGTAASKKEVLKIVEEALLLLPLESRAALLLRDQQNLPYEQIAQVLEKQLKDVKSLVLSARVTHQENVKALVQGDKPA